jgi:antitoxin HigA-1
MTLTAPRSPGEAVAELFTQQGLNQTEAAAKLSISRPYLNGVINGKYPLTAELRLKMSSVFGTKPEFWSEVQRSYDKWHTSDDGQATRRAAAASNLHTNLDLTGGHVMVDHEIEASVNAGVLGIDGFERDQLRATSYHFTLGLRGFLYLPGNTEPKSVATKPGLVLKRGQAASL